MVIFSLKKKELKFLRFELIMPPEFLCSQDLKTAFRLVVREKI